MNNGIDNGSNQHGYHETNQNSKRVCNRFFFSLFSQQKMSTRTNHATDRIVDNINVSKSSNAIEDLKQFKTCADEKTDPHRFEACMFVKKKRHEQAKRQEKEDVQNTIFPRRCGKLRKLKYKPLSKCKIPIEDFCIPNSIFHIAFEGDDPNKKKDIKY